MTAAIKKQNASNMRMTSISVTSILFLCAEAGRPRAFDVYAQVDDVIRRQINNHSLCGYDGSCCLNSNKAMK